ncbi:MAG TPA: sulfatase [Pseudomonadales bacterium]|jgi:arylsulfatase A-like enzyme
MRRRDFLKTASALSALGLLQSIGCRPASGPMNVLFVCIDDLNDWVGCLGGYPGVLTPNIDRLASQGVLFTNAHAAVPACHPSRMATLTGVRPTTSGVYHNRQPHWRETAWGQGVQTLPQAYMQAGYRVMGSGKIFHGQDPASWHEYWPSDGAVRPVDYMPPRNALPLSGMPGVNRAIDTLDWGYAGVHLEQMSDYQVAQWTAGQLQKQTDKPFFLGCGIFRPHLPWYVPKRWFDLYPLDQVVLPDIRDDDLSDVPPEAVAFIRRGRSATNHENIMRHGKWREAVQGYLASISFADSMLGIVLDALDASPYRDNTVVVLWSDNGWHLGEKLHWKKFTLWEEATRVPLVFRLPPAMKMQGRCDEAVSLVDIFPTLMDVCGLPKSTALEGESLLPQLLNPATLRQVPAVSTWSRVNHSLRTREWRYTRYGSGAEELYNHRSDPQEWNNLAGNADSRAIMDALRPFFPEHEVPYSPPLERGKKSGGDD